ncbi:hypothetical protein GCM10027598_01340 [Amycolatopsis oliviviridis]
MISAHSTKMKLSTITQTSTGPAVSSQPTPMLAASVYTSLTPRAYVYSANRTSPNGGIGVSSPSLSRVPQAQ